MRRIVVIGCAGSGKTVLSKALAQKADVRHYERDGLGHLGGQQYLQALDRMARADDWLLDGAPYFAEALVYGRADTVVALDYRRSLVMWRVLRRTLRVELTRVHRGAHRPVGVRTLLRDTEHPLWWAWTSHGARSKEANEILQRPDLAGATVLRFRSPGETRAWLATVR